MRIIKSWSNRLAVFGEPQKTDLQSHAVLHQIKDDIVAKYKVVAKDSAGKRVESVIESVNAAAAAATIRRDQMTPISISEMKGSFWNMSLGGNKPPKPRAKNEDLVLFTRQFATMIDAGITVIECLDILQEQIDDKAFKLAIQMLRDDVRSGSDLSTALGRFPTVFTPLFVNMIRAGEASGELDVILARLAQYLEKAESLKRKIKSAMTYPAVSLTLVLGITIFLLVFIVPKFESMFKSMAITLPLPTRIVLAVSTFLAEQWYVTVALIVGPIVFTILTRRTKRGRYLWDAFFLKLPVFGELINKVALSRFSRTFATMLRSGVAILGALEIVATTAGNGVVEEAVLTARDAVRRGETLAAPLEECDVFTPMVVRMIAVGERSGSLETLLEKIAEFYDDQVDAAVSSLTSVIEPLMIGVMGVLVGGIVLAIFLPILEIQKTMGRR